MLEIMKLNRPVASLFGNRATSILSGGITTIIVLAVFSPELQGYHYTLMTMVAISSLAELGFAGAAQQFAAHEWAFLNLNERRVAVGPEKQIKRLAAIMWMSIIWATVAGALLATAIGIVGFVMFSRTDTDVSWQLPLLILALAVALDFANNLVLATLEGCDQVAEIGITRTVRVITYSMVTWLIMVTGGELLAVPIGIATGSTLTSVVIAIRWRRFLANLILRSGLKALEWRREFFPLQMKFSVASIANYVVYSLLVPITFWIEGPVAAGQFGITWYATQSIIEVSGSWFVANVPQYGKFVVLKDRTSLNQLAISSTVKSLGTLTVMIIFILVGLGLLNHFLPELGQRFLETKIVVLLFIFGLLRIVIWSLSVYSRAHKAEPFLYMGIIISPITLVIFVSTMSIWDLQIALLFYSLGSTIIIGPIASIVFMRFYGKQTIISFEDSVKSSE